MSPSPALAGGASLCLVAETQETHPKTVRTLYGRPSLTAWTASAA
jgi:hypothetical protein